MAIATLKFAPHPISKLFPPMTADELDDLIKSVKADGVQQRGVLLDGLLLDGNNRQVAALKGGVPVPDPIPWEKMPEAVRSAGPTAYVLNTNMRRRHLTPSQRAVIASQSLPFFEQEAAERKKAALKQNQQPTAPEGASGNGATTETGGKKKPAKKSGSGKAAAAAGKALGVSARSVERAKQLQKKDPKKFEEVKAGKGTLGKATRDLSAAEKQKQAEEFAKNEITTALQKAKWEPTGIAAVLKKVKGKALLAFGRMKPDDISKAGGLIETGMDPKKAMAFKAKNLTAKSTVQDMINAAAAEGGKDGGFFEINGWTFDVAQK